MRATCAQAAETDWPLGQKRGRQGVLRAQDDLPHIRRTLPNAHLHVEMSALPAAILDTNPETALTGICRRTPRSAFPSRAIRLQ
jgi:hypothetical protein